MNILESLKWRYATKSFDTNKIVSKEKLQVLKEGFSLTATSYGLQPVRMVIIEDKNLQQELVEHSYNQQQIAQASHVLVLCIENVIDNKYIETYFENVKKLRGTPDTILNPFKEYLLDSFSNKKDTEIKDWATKQAYIALGNLLTVCAVEKIDACPMEGFVPAEYDKVLNLTEKGLTSVLVLPIGYRAKDDMFANFAKVRKNISESVLEL
ncbi:NAD(P)H-dependent oxidoreductase [Pseudofulvibacter geojedonensis]|uniref:NAD(P)H-dependent oxidoreductase n=1 Tax=Pseudofulvibacter geojedonensis TaxID=1123758 RepID=A0ABW3I2U5_9FLAO